MTKMKFFLLLIAIKTFALAYTSNIGIRLNENETDTRHSLITSDDNGNIKIINLRNTTIEKKPSLADVTYYFSTKETADTPIVIKNNDINSIKGFKNDSQTIFLIHGWENDHTSPFNSLLASAFFKSYDVNIFVVDWGTLANKNYFTAKNAVTKIGKFVGDFVKLIADQYKKSFKDFTLIGHSLGAHVAGYAGSTVKDKVDLIVGLDPAQPLFTYPNTAERLDPTDADFVHVIHTNAGVLGFLSPVGHADYYPNGGSNQPGCFDVVGSSCSHSKSYMYYADSIINKGMQLFALKCKKYEDFIKGKCRIMEDLSIMGRFPVDRSASGSYYLTTKEEEPYAEDERPFIDIVLDSVERME